MNIIVARAEQYVKYSFRETVPHHKSVLDHVSEELAEIDNNFDKISFINVIIKANNDTFEGHKLKCTNPECSQDFEHGNIEYFLTQELKRIGISLDTDTFSAEEKEDSDSKLNQILNDLNSLKLGQEIIYTDLLKEINELRDLYFLGKKKWHQLLVGKCVDMVASGIVSEVVSKKIIEDFTEHLPNLIK